MSPAELREQLSELNPSALLADGFDGALIGIVRQFNRYLALYDYDKAVEIVADDIVDVPGASLDRLEEAAEYMEFNVVGAWLGENTPLFLVQR